MFSKNYQRMIVAVVAIAVLGVTGVGYADPAMSLETLSDWETALGDGTVSPLTTAEFSDLQADNLGFDAPFVGTYIAPELAAVDADSYPLEGGETLEGPGLVMSWGDEQTPAEYTAAWQYVYPADPNIVGQTLTVTLCPPQFGASGAQITSVGIGFTDNIGLVRTWTWNVAGAVAANTIVWNQNWNVSIGPIAGVLPAVPPGIPGPASATDQATGVISVTPIFFSAGTAPAVAPAVAGPPFFNPLMAMSIEGYESGLFASGMALPPGGTPNLPLWNWWGNVVVTPEPTTMSLLAIGPLAILRRRRR